MAQSAFLMPAASPVSAGDWHRVFLEAVDVTKSFHRGLWPRRRTLSVLRGARLTLRPGEIVGLVGENDSGKSTFMKIMSGALSRDGGAVRWSGRIGYCPQDPVLYQQLTCNEHFELFGRAYAMTRQQVAAAVTASTRSWGSATGPVPG